MPSEERKQVIERRRIKSVGDARAIYNRYVEANRERNAIMAQVRNQMEGGRPMDPEKQRERGAEGETNVNFRDAEAAFDRTYLPYWKMVNDVPSKTAVTIDSNSIDSKKWEAAYEECVDLFFNDWGLGYFVNFMIATSEFVRFGPGYTMWPNQYTPRFEALDTERVYLPKRTKMEVEKWECVCVARDMTASELIEKVSGKGTRARSEYAGWNTKAIDATLLSAANESETLKGKDAATIQDEIVSNDLRWSSEWAPFRTIWMFVRNMEKGGKIQTYVFTESGPDKNAGLDDFLYVSDAFTSNFKEIFGALFFGVGKGGLVHSIKGFGIKNYHFAMLINRSKCRLMDGATIASGLNFQRTSETPDETPPIANYAGCNIFPEGMTPISIQPSLKVGMSVIEALSQNAAENNAMYRENQDQIEQTDTATQANLLANMAGQNAAAIGSIYLAMVGENMFAEIVRRLRIKGSDDPDAKKFRKRMQNRGVPDEVIHDVEIVVRTGANAGNSSFAQRGQVWQQGLGMQGQPGWNAQFFREGWVAHNFGSQAVKKALLPDGQDSEPAARKMAMIENGVMGHGQSLPVDQNEMHFEHAQEHLKPLAAIASAAQHNPQSITPEHVAALMTALPHVQQHIQALAGDDTKKQQLKQVKPVFTHVESVTRGIMAKLAKARATGQDPRQALAAGANQPAS